MQVNYILLILNLHQTANLFFLAKQTTALNSVKTFYWPLKTDLIFNLCLFYSMHKNANWTKLKVMISHDQSVFCLQYTLNIYMGWSGFYYFPCNWNRHSKFSIRQSKTVLFNTVTLRSNSNQLSLSGQCMCSEVFTQHTQLCSKKDSSG